MKKKFDIHPRVPAALKRDLKKCAWNLRALARLRDVNVYWVIRLVKYGEEPKNKTTRLKLSLPARRRCPSTVRDARPPVPDYERWWRKLSKDARSLIKRSVYDGFCEHQSKEN